MSPPGPNVLGNTSESGVTELPTHKHKWMQEENRMLRKCILRVIKILGDLWRECIGCGLREGGREMSEQRLRTQVQNIEKKKLLSDVEIEEIVVAGRAEDDIEVVNEGSDEVDGDLDVAIEEEQNIGIDFVCQWKDLFMFVGEEKKLGY